MLTKRIIPCLDVSNGRVVKGVNFENLKDAGCPIEVSKLYNSLGADEICFLDITASIEKRSLLFDMIRKISEQIFIPLTVGGGISKKMDVRELLNSGADKISVNSSAVNNPNLIHELSSNFGSQCIVVAIDAKKNKKKKTWEVFTHGGRNPTGLDVLSWCKKVEQLGAGEILLTSMDKDGTKNGFDNELISEVSKNVNIPIIASGGVGSLEHFLQGVLHGNADALLAASVFHYKLLSIKEVKEYLSKNDVPVRL
jgi:cyclase